MTGKRKRRRGRDGSRDALILADDPDRGESGNGGSVRATSPTSESFFYSEALGDSEASDGEESAVEEQDERDKQSAVAEDESKDTRPALQASCGRKRVRNTAPPTVAGEERRALRNATLTDRDDVGNIGFFFGNWGRRTQQGGGGVQ